MVLTMNSNSIIQMEKDRRKSVRRKRRRDLRSMLGPTWSSQELFCFYNAYRKYGTDWLKVGAELHEVRTKVMLEALYSMNKTYLSLREGIATAGGFIAIVVDRCKLLEESDGDQETDGAKGQVNEHRVSSSTANGKVHKERCGDVDGDDDDEKTISYSQVPEFREQTSRSMHQNESTSSSPCRVKNIITLTSKGYKGIAKCSSKPKYNIRGGSMNDRRRGQMLNREDDRVVEEGNNSRSRSFQVSNPENNKLRKLLQEDERVGIACEALLDLSTVTPKTSSKSVM